jgi:Carboxypeptidase regulatory-like domain
VAPVVQRIAVLRTRPVSAVAAAMLALGLATVPAAAHAASTPGQTPHSRGAAPGRESAGIPSFGMVTGVIHGAAGSAPAGVCVTVTGQYGTRTVRSSGTGRYLLAGLRAGSYSVSYTDCADLALALPVWSGTTYLPSGTEHVLVQPGRSLALAPVSLGQAESRAAMAAQQREIRASPAQAAAAGSISGTVRNRSGKPLAGICVTVWSKTGDGYSGYGLSTGSHGAYRIYVGVPGVPTRGLRVQFTAGFFCGNHGNYAPRWWRNATSWSKATSLTIKRGQHLKGINATMPAGGEITGVVRASNETHSPLRGICVAAVPSNNSINFLVPDQVATRANGSYRVEQLGTGGYKLQFQSAAGCGGTENYLPYNDPHTIHVLAGKLVRGINVSMRPGGAITGVVGAAGKSVAGACVQAVPSGGQVQGEAMTGANGSYSIQQLAAGAYQVSFSGGCGNSASYAPQYYPDQQNAAAATSITVGPGQTRPGIDASLLPGATISGRVTSLKGKPLGNICVQAWSRQEILRFSVTPLVLIAIAGGGGQQTAASGRYSIPNLAPDSYYLQFGPCFGEGDGNLAMQWYSPAPGQTGPSQVSAPAGTVTGGINAVLGPGGVISGTVKNARGQPQDQACITAGPTRTSTLDDFAFFTQQTGSNGHYQLGGLPTGSYKVVFQSCGATQYAADWYNGKTTFSAATAVHVRAGRTTGGINGVLRAGQSITGTVTSGVTGRPLANVCVFANDRQGFPVAVDFTGRKGTFNVPELAAGTYSLQFSHCAGTSALAPVTLRGVRVVRTRPTTGIHAVLRPGGSISGTVLGGSGDAAQPGVCVVATPKTGDGLAASAATGPAGTYRIRGLASGKYQILFAADCADGAAALASATDPGLVSVTPGTTRSGVGATLASDGQITGTVTNQSTAGVAGICVTAQPVAAGAAPVVAVTSGNGGYAIPALAPGSYTLEFLASCDATGYATQWWQDASSASAATKFSVAAGATVTRDAILTATP